MSPDIIKVLSVCFIVVLAWCVAMFAIALSGGWFDDDRIELHDSKDGGRR